MGDSCGGFASVRDLWQDEVHQGESGGDDLVAEIAD
jgi:hypothetical protein